MPTGYALHDPRQQLVAAAERVLLREGASGLTGRSVTAEAGVAKGVLHRHFPDFDTFVAHLVTERIRGFHDVTEHLTVRLGQATVSENVAIALRELLDPVVLALVPLIIAHPQIRNRIATNNRPGPPLLSDAAAVVQDYLSREQRQGRITATADIGTAALSVIATAHLLLAGELGALPTTDAIVEVTESILVGIERNPKR
ncbi:TetR/AcrR family transcriptional regulator [Actinoplanes sp. NPDC051494]|uniref:TetR/AcrR family transcriptional regulator n=1 Tax=Actinoplanes sp. NPDC051494 TaxID=3363907 RepID=UPI00379C3958